MGKAIYSLVRRTPPGLVYALFLLLLMLATAPAFRIVLFGLGRCPSAALLRIRLSLRLLLQIALPEGLQSRRGHFRLRLKMVEQTF